MATQFAIDPAQTTAQNANSSALVRAHMGLARRIARQVHARMSSALDIDDLAQTGLVALVECARTYEDRGHAFSTYASMRVRGAMIDALRSHAAQSRAATGKRRAIAAARHAFEQAHCRAPNDAELASALGLDGPGFHAMAAGARALRHEPIDALYSDHMTAFADDAEAADEGIDRARREAVLTAAIRTLPEREAMVLQLYFVEARSLDEIGASLGVGAARVCQIKKAALDKLRAMLGERV